MMFFAPRRRPGAQAAEPGEPGAASPTAQWLERLARGDVQALDHLYRREADRVYRYALAVCGNSAWAADATQEAFVALATRPEGFDPARGALGAYLAGVARHALSARWRELRREGPLGEGIDAAHDGADGAVGMPVAAEVEAAASPETLLVRAQEVQALWAALRALPVVFREAVVLVDLQERSYVEAAQIAGLELNTLRTRLHRARARLARLLGTRAGAPRAQGVPE